MWVEVGPGAGLEDARSPGTDSRTSVEREGQSHKFLQLSCQLLDGVRQVGTALKGGRPAGRWASEDARGPGANSRRRGGCERGSHKFL